ARSAARLRAVRRRPGSARAARGARSRNADSRRAEGPGENDGRRARLVLRPGRRMAGDVRAAQLLVRLEGRARRGADERAREGFLDGAQNDAVAEDAYGRGPRQRDTVTLRS